MTPAVLALAGCLAVTPGADRILGRDLAAAFPELAEAAGDAPLSFAPTPNVRRVFSISELRRLAARYQVDRTPDAEICFERKTATLGTETLLAAMHRSLPDARIEIVEASRATAPEGEPEFPVSGLRQTPAGATWNGFVRYAGGRRFFLWAKVKVAVTAPRVVATQTLKPGVPVEASQLRVETGDRFPGAAVLATVEEAAGRISRRTVPAGTVLQPQWLEPAREVVRGQTVQVEVISGSARLTLEAEAEASGSAGQTIPVRNPESKKRFAARVEGQGRVSVGKGKP
ncbi:MAG TPA: flagellar basal body P-ring formation chaperone FlgA [Bryobacteraceae bacterium]|jgi:flagella basal body P-ring formation protein FlgA